MVEVLVATVDDTLEAFVVELAARVVEELLFEVDDPLTEVLEDFVVELAAIVDE